MKKWVIALLIGTLLLQVSAGLFIMISFQIHKNEIVATQCINRFDKIPVCFGSCYLEKELKKSVDTEDQKLPTVKIKGIEVCIPQQLNALAFESHTSNESRVSKPSFFYQVSSTKESIITIFHPPQNLA